MINKSDFVITGMIIKQLLDEAFVIFEIIKVEVSFIHEYLFFVSKLEGENHALLKTP